MRVVRGKPVNSCSWHAPASEVTIHKTEEVLRKDFGMGLNDARNAMQLRVLSELAAIWKKLADDPAAPNDLRAQAGEMVEEFKQFEKLRDPNATEHFEGEQLLVRMARYLPQVAEVHTTPEDAKGVLQGEE